MYGHKCNVCTCVYTQTNGPKLHAPTCTTHRNEGVTAYVEGGRLTDDDRKDDEDYDDEDNPELDVLPPQLPLEAGGCPLEHVCILVQVFCTLGGGEGRRR